MLKASFLSNERTDEITGHHTAAREAKSVVVDRKDQSVGSTSGIFYFTVMSGNALPQESVAVALICFTPSRRRNVMLCSWHV